MSTTTIAPSRGQGGDRSSPLFDSPKAACDLLGCGLTFCYELMRTGKLKTIKLGSARH